MAGTPDRTPFGPTGPPPIQTGLGLNGYDPTRPTPAPGEDPYSQLEKAYPGMGSAAQSASYRGEQNYLPRVDANAAATGALRGSGRAIANSANGIDPAGNRAAIFNREAQMRQRVATRAAALAALDARTKAAPSTAAAQARVDASRAAANKVGLGAGGLLGTRARLARAARTDQAVAAAAGQRAGQEAVGRLAERASYRSGAGQVLGTGGGTSASMLRAGSDAERRGVSAQTDLVRRGTTLERDLATQQGKTLAAGGNIALDWSGRRGKAGANLAHNVGLLEADRLKYANDMDAIALAERNDRIRGDATMVATLGNAALRSGG